METLPQEVESPEGLVLFGGGEGLAPLRLAHLTPGMILPCHLFTVAEAIPGGLALTWRRGQPLPREARDMVWGYFSVAEAGEILSYLLSRTAAIGIPEEDPEALPLLADTLLVWTQHFFSHDTARTQAQVAEARHLIQALVPGLGRAEKVLETVGRLRRHDSGLFSHCLNVSLLALVFALHLGWEEKEAENLALGALLHDLGMMPWAQENFHQTAPLSDEDWEEIKTHPARGAELLESLDLIPAEIPAMIRQHHECPDGSGYPLGLTGPDLTPWGRALRILDSYEAMTSLRPWRPPLSGRQALHIMTSAWSGRGSYDQEFLKSFISFCQRG